MKATPKTANKLSTIIRKILNPNKSIEEIMEGELKFGCKLEWRDCGIGIIVNVIKYKIESDTYDIFWLASQQLSRTPYHPKYEILGLPITTDDILLALKNTKGHCMETNGDILGSEHDFGDTKLCNWKLKTPIHNQDEKELLKLIELLT